MCLFPMVGHAEVDTLRLTLEDCIVMARRQSVDAAVALGELKSAYWEWRSYKADLLPEVSLSANVPTYNKRYSTYQREDGTHSYVRNDFMEVDGSLYVSQKIWPTGGTLSVESSLDWLRQMSGETSGGKNQFMSMPIALTLSQPLFGVNSVKWNRRIEPLRYREAKASFLAETEQVAMRAISLFFNLLLANENVHIAEQNLQNAEKLYEVAKAKREMGTISQNDVLQMRLNMLNAQSSLTSTESSRKARMFELKAFLDVEERRQLEADYSVAYAKGNQRSVTLYAQVGYTGTASRMNEAYRDLLSKEVVQVGVSLPLLDWGKRRGQVKVAESNREIVRNQVRQQSQEFNQNLFVLTEQFNHQRQQLRIAEEADTIAQRRYHTNVETFKIGSISTLELSDAQTAKDEARQNRLAQLFNYWYYYYQLRSITLWDFERNQNINVDFDKIVR